MRNIYTEIIETVFESRDLSESFLRDALKVAKSLKTFKHDKKSALELVKIIFKGRLNIAKKLKITKLYSLKEGWISYEGIFLEKHSWRDYRTKKLITKEEQEVRVEIQIEDYRIICNIVFIDSGEIRQSQWRPDQ